MLVAAVYLIIKLDDLMTAVILMGFFSLLSSSIFMVLDAVDVAFTEAAVGAGASTIFILAALAIVGRTSKKRKRAATIIPLIICIGVGAVLIYATLDMPRFGSPDAPVHTHVAPRYINDSAEEVGPPNIVTSVLASYRGYDTFGEAGVVFTAFIGVVLLLGAGSRAPGALYVQWHGDFGPGGGFQAGVIFASAVVLYALIYGIVPAQGGNFLDYGALLADKHDGQHYGILIIELGIGITVAAVMINIFYSLSERSI